MKVYNIILIAVGLVFFNESLAQSIPEQLSLNEAISIALERNFDIKLARNNSEILTNNAVKSNVGYLPQVGLSGTYNYQNQNTYSEFASDQIPPIDVRGAETQTINAGVNMNYTIYNGGNRKYTYQKLQNDAQVGLLQERFQIENTTNAVIRQYLSALNFYQSFLIREQSIELSTQRYARAYDSYSYGSTSKLELLNAQVDLSNDSSAFLQSIIDYKKSKSELNLLMGLEAAIEYALDTSISINENLDLQEFMDKLLNKNSQYLIQQSLSENSVKDLKINNSQRYPNLSLTGGYNYSRQDFEASFIQQSENLGWNAGITLSYNIFDGNRVNRNEQNARILMESQEYSLEKLEISLKKDLTNAFDEYEAGKRLLALRKNNLELANTNYERSMEAFKLGQITGIQLREAQLNLLNARYSLTLQKIQTKNAEVNLYLLSGSLVEN